MNYFPNPKRFVKNGFQISPKKGIPVFDRDGFFMYLIPTDKQKKKNLKKETLKMRLGFQKV